MKNYVVRMYLWLELKSRMPVMLASALAVFAIGCSDRPSDPAIEIPPAPEFDVDFTVTAKEHFNGYNIGEPPVICVSQGDTVRIYTKYSGRGSRAVRLEWSWRLKTWEGHTSEKPLRSIEVKSQSGTDSLVQVFPLPYPTGHIGIILLRISGEDGKSTLDSVELNFSEGRPKVDGQSTPPVFLGDPISLVGRERTGDQCGHIVKYEWDIGATGKFIPASGDDTLIYAPMAPNQNFTCVLRATDDDGLATENASVFAVRNWKPWESVASSSLSVTYRNRSFLLVPRFITSHQIIQFIAETKDQVHIKAPGSGRALPGGNGLFWIQEKTAIHEYSSSLGSFSQRGTLGEWIDTLGNDIGNVDAVAGRLPSGLFAVVKADHAKAPSLASHILRYVPANGSWEKSSRFPGSAAMTPNRVMFAGNRVYVVQDAFYGYDPASDSWTRLCDLPFAPGDYRIESAIDHDGRPSFLASKGEDELKHNRRGFVAQYDSSAKLLKLYPTPILGINAFAWHGERLFALTLKFLGKILATTPVEIGVLEFDGTDGWANKLPVQADPIPSEARTLPFGIRNGTAYFAVPAVSGNELWHRFISYKIYD